MGQVSLNSDSFGATQTIGAGSGTHTHTKTETATQSGITTGSLLDLDAEVPLPQLCERIHSRVHAFLDSDPGSDRLRLVQEQTRISLKVIEEALEKYSLDELSMSYNGGKDCLVLLILYLAGLHIHFSSSSHSKPPTTLESVYILARDPFDEVETFVAKSTQAFHLSLARYQKPMREGFASYLADRPQTKAVFVGTRRTDPHGAQLTHFDPTDHGWPAFMRIHPVIDWRYADVWAFIRHLGVPYCSLYDLGYTSLGGTGDTARNPVLKVAAGGNSSKSAASATSFRPAYELVADEDERLGRGVSVVGKR